MYLNIDHSFLIFYSKRLHCIQNGSVACVCVSRGGVGVWGGSGGWGGGVGWGCGVSVEVWGGECVWGECVSVGGAI